MITILLIEEDNEIRKNVSEILTLARYKIITAVNGKEGIEKARAQRPEVIVCAIMMSGIDGFCVLNIIRNDPLTRHTHFIFLTARNDPEDFRQAIKSGANDFIVKPFSGGDLLDAIKCYIESSRAIADAAEDGVLLSPLISIPEHVPFENNTAFAINDVTIQASLKHLLADCELERFMKKNVVYREGSLPRNLYFVRAGKVKAFRSHQDGKNLIVDLFTEGDFMGYAPILLGTNHIETAEVIESSELIIIPKKKLDDLLNTEPPLVKFFLDRLAKDFIEKDQRLLGLAYNTLRKKVAEALLIIEKKYRKQKDEEFEVDIEREELASIAGTATESLIRTLYAFKNENLIEMRNGIITGINAMRLQLLRR